MSEPIVNQLVPPSLVFGENATQMKMFPKEGAGVASFKDGIPSDYSTTAENPLKARVDDVNAIGRLASGFHNYCMSGGLITFNSEVADLIGGYPNGALLEYWDGTNYRRVMSLIDHNKYDFVSSPNYIDGVRWVYADSWGSPYAIYVDPSRVVRIEALTAGRENPALGWSDDKAYQYTGITKWPSGEMDLRKTRWIRIEFDSFVIVTAPYKETLDNVILYYVYSGFRVKDSSGVMSTYTMPVDEAGNTDNGSIYPVSGGTWVGTVSFAFSVYSTCLYMRAGSFIQLVYATALSQDIDISMQVVRLRR